MKTADFDYTLPPELIAQTPVEPRDHSRLLVLDRQTGKVEHRRFFDIAGYFQRGDVLVFNDSRVIPARLKATKSDSNGKLEILLLRRLEPNTWQTLVKPAKRANPGTKLELSLERRDLARLSGEILGTAEDGIRIIRFSDENLLFDAGEIPLPPYIHEPLADKERYQTVYSRISGSVAAPTAGLHFTPGLISTLQSNGVECLFVTLHVGLDTFRAVREKDPVKHVIHREYGILAPETAERLVKAKAEGRRVFAVGTTSVRVLEAVAQAGIPLEGFSGFIDLFILPGHKFRMVDTMITNFHLPSTTLLMLVSAFAGKDRLLDAYREAIKEHYRFYSFGDAMLIT